MNQKGFRKFFKARRKKFPYKLFFGLIALLGSVLGLAYFFLFSDFFIIREINVENNKELSADKIIGAVLGEIRLFENILFANTSKASEMLKESTPKIAEAIIKKELPDKITIIIKERKPIAVFLNSEDRYYIDKDGVVYEIAPEGAAFPIVTISNFDQKLAPGRKILEKEGADKLMEIVSKFENNLKIPIKKINFASAYRVNIETEEGWNVRIALQDDISWQIEKLAVILNEKLPPETRGNLQYIELRFDKVYIFPEIN